MTCVPTLTRAGVIGGLLTAALLIPTATVVGASPALAMTRPAAGSGPCVTLTLSARPKVNAQTAPFETIKSRVASCSSATETIRLIQTLSGPFARTGAAADRSSTIVLQPGQAVTKVRHIPYSCCGTFDVRDVARSGGAVLVTRTTSFTFA